MRLKVYWAIAFSLALNLSFPVFAQSKCDEDCLKEWFKKQFPQLDLAPPELQADFLLRQCRTEIGREKSIYVLNRIEELISQTPEEVPVIPVIGYTDSLPGEASRALAKNLNRMSLEMKSIRLLAELDSEAASERWRAFQVPTYSANRYLRGEAIDFGIYFETAFYLFDLLHRQNRSLQANHILIRALDSLNSSESLVALHDILGKRLNQSLVSDLMLELYTTRLARLSVDTSPELVTWLRIVYFWKLLLRGEAFKQKLPLLEAILSFVGKASSANNLSIRFRVQTSNGEKLIGGFWPSEARTHWLRMTSDLQFNEMELNTMGQIDKAFQKQAGQLSQDTKLVPMAAFWSTPASYARLDALRALTRSRKDLQPAGFWEPRLSAFLAELRQDSSPPKDDQYRLLDFFEKALLYRALFAMSDYQPSDPVAKLDPFEVKKQLDARPGNQSKRLTIDSFLDLLESEEGRWAYSKRRVLWLGLLLQFVDEIAANQPDLQKTWSSRSSSSSNDLIRLYSDLSLRN